MEMIFSIVLGKNVVLFSQLKSAFGDAIGDASHDPTKMRVSSCFVILRIVEPKNDVIELAGIVGHLIAMIVAPKLVISTVMPLELRKAILRMSG